MHFGEEWRGIYFNMLHILGIGGYPSAGATNPSQLPTESWERARLLPI